MLKLWSRASTLFLFSLLILLGFTSAKADGAAKVVLSQLDTDAFPGITARLNVHNNLGYFVHGLEPVDITILENENAIPVETLTEVNSGAQFVIALNMGPSYAIRNQDGISRHESIVQAVADWEDSKPDSESDDFNLVTNSTVEEIHTAEITNWVPWLLDENLTPDSLTPSLDTLVQAINTASDPVSPGNLQPGILFITPHPVEGELAALPSLISQAKQRGIQVYVWMVSSKAYANSDSAVQLSQLASETGGDFFVFSGDETLPDIENLIDPLRYSYWVTYQSQITTGENHLVAARVNTLGITSPQLPFELQVLPPNPIFITPPLKIQRIDQTSSHDILERGPDYSPKDETIQILIEFPDGILRLLQQTSFYVDGSLVSTNTSPPFDQFIWPLEDYTANTTLPIKIEAEDILGLTGTSIEHNVQIEVIKTLPSILAVLKQKEALAAGILAVLVIGAAFFILIITGRIQPRAVGRLRPETRSNKAKKSSATQPSTHQRSKPARIKIPPWGYQLPWRKEQERVDETAYLELIESVNNAVDQERIAITQREIIFGSHKDLAAVHFADPSVEASHARLYKDQDGHFYLEPKKSIAGTWVNYQLLPPDGVKLKHGDIIHIGRVGMCFKYSDHRQIPKPKVIPLEAS
ncbi:MAG: FHA domain-containing protein [Chloroflexota bacterium]